MLRAAGNPFQHDSASQLIPGREPYHNDFIPKACKTTAELEKLFKKGFPSLAQEIVDINRGISSLQHKKANLQELARPGYQPHMPSSNQDDRVEDPLARPSSYRDNQRNAHPYARQDAYRPNQQDATRDAPSESPW